MKKDTLLYYLMLKTTKYLRKKIKLYGYAVSAVTVMKVQMHLVFAQFAETLKLYLLKKLTTTRINLRLKKPLFFGWLSESLGSLFSFCSKLLFFR